MRILIITQWFDPEPTFKGMMFVQELRRLGHDVEVLTGYPNYPGGEIYEGYQLRPWQRERHGDICVTRVPLYPSHSRSALGRILNYISFAVSATIAALLLQRPDVVYLYHPPGTVALSSMALRLFKRVPFVIDIQDMWPDTLSATGMLTSKRPLRIIGWWMQRVYKAASYIGVLSSGFRNALIERGVPSEKIVVIPNWTYEFYEDNSEKLSVELELAEELYRDDRVNIVFAGTMGRAQALDAVLSAAQLVADKHPAVRFVFVGGGIEVGRLKGKAEELGLSNVLFLPRRSPARMSEIFAWADFLLVHLRDDPLFAVTIPGKTQAYLRAGRPILMGVKGDAASIVLEAKAGLIFEPENPQSLSKVIDSALALSPEARLDMGEAGRGYYNSEMSLKVGASRWSDTLSRASLAERRGFGLKRLFDILVSASLLLALSPLMCGIALLIAISIGRPVIFRQKRPGRFGATFLMFKFRTMTDSRDMEGILLPDEERLTRFGVWLRKTSLDELPGLINVLRGEMSLVGPRPLLHRYMPYYTAEERLRMLVRPGITGLAQVNGRNLVSWDERLKFDVTYIRGWSLRLDLKILWRTVLQVLQRRNVVVAPASVMQDLDFERRARGDP